MPVILHTDHCSKALLPWFDGLLEANEEYFAKHGEPLFSSHMLDLSEESIEENMEISAKYLKRMAAINCFLEVEIGITGGEEDGVDNTDANPEDLYSKPEEIHQVYKALEPVAPGMFSIAAAFGNVHGVYSPGNVKLTPKILAQRAGSFVKAEEGLETDKPCYFVFHGGSGSSREDIREAIDYGVIKMNIDTDTQWSFWDGVKDYARGQVRLPPGPDRQPRRPREAQQEVLRPPHVAPRGRDVHRQPPPRRVRGPQRHGRPLQVNILLSMSHQEVRDGAHGDRTKTKY